ncbi:1-deoxy-D-xylulose-5-phosphate reductoisomerase [Novimethylophilus kurashikiensis]|uniref:1-deoxy-D-xylulose 5-phosphate reductoisomerase n=1 Tax=Novimethylophilus kurashikiensis TaxID=1825523 RepID=A0A2R5F8Q2_9PROT|nr:1-deoxy-D-xylulose-5-phosphate reductoisomerase [Novimethylophilus kurashikiensis]GBG13014.1 1-deoxy-D-xylulose-5-phosphate reductoisomerase [Novimethylophilus kurashikiensis]
MSKVQNITVLGATGTIGANTLDVIARHPGRFRAYALTAHSKVEPLLRQCQQFHPRYAVMLDPDAAERLEHGLRSLELDTEVLCGIEAMEFVSSLEEVDAVMAAIVGAAGLKPALAAANAGKKVLLANKETLVMSGALFMQAVRQGGATLLPIDSEHNAIFQCMPPNFSQGLGPAGITKILLTASGGPFRKFTLDQLAHVTPAQALNHPNWVMGPKITIDSATLMNKGLEVIEAHWLFDAAPDQIEVVIHPQSVIHSMVQYNDGSVLAELGNPDMRTPIAHALGCPERIESGVAPLDIFAIGQLNFERPDTGRFPCLRLAFEALDEGGTAPAVLNAANEIAVQAFLAGNITFMDIPRMIETTLSEVGTAAVSGLDDVVNADAQARAVASDWLERKVTC